MKALILTCTAVATLALAATAAATGNGASVTDTSGCVAGPFFTTCTDVHLVTKATSTPSGGTAYVTNGTTTFTQTGFGCDYTRTEPVHLSIHAKDGETQVDHERLIQTISFGCASGFAQTCTQTIELQFANGEARVQRYDFVCTNP